MSTCEESVIAKIRWRQQMGLNRYRASVERTDLTRLQWLVHAQNQAMDFAIYLEKLIREENGPDLSAPPAVATFGVEQGPDLGF